MNKDFIFFSSFWITYSREIGAIYYFVAEIEPPALSRQYLDNPQER